MTVLATCHCGAVEITLPSSPTEVTECTCSICRRYGALWAYFPPDTVRIQTSVPTATYAWGDKSLEFHRCSQCGCVTHWASTSRAREKMGINARLLPLEVLDQAKVRHLDGDRPQR